MRTGMALTIAGNPGGLQEWLRFHGDAGVDLFVFLFSADTNSSIRVSATEIAQEVARLSSFRGELVFLDIPLIAGKGIGLDAAYQYCCENDICDWLIDGQIDEFWLPAGGFKHSLEELNAKSGANLGFRQYAIQPHVMLARELAEAKTTSSYRHATVEISARAFDVIKSDYKLPEPVVRTMREVGHFERSAEEHSVSSNDGLKILDCSVMRSLLHVGALSAESTVASSFDELVEGWLDNELACINPALDIYFRLDEISQKK